MCVGCFVACVVFGAYKTRRHRYNKLVRKTVIDRIPNTNSFQLVAIYKYSIEFLVCKIVAHNRSDCVEINMGNFSNLMPQHSIIGFAFVSMAEKRAQEEFVNKIEEFADQQKKLYPRVIRKGIFTKFSAHKKSALFTQKQMDFCEAVTFRRLMVAVHASLETFFK